MPNDAISVNHVSKLFRRQKQGTFKEMLPALLGGKKVVDTFWALKDVDLHVKRGETLGIIGLNGSGKSTLLKLIAGVSLPTKGDISINGRIAPLIELGAGFHPELTGRENVFLNGVILGMSHKEVEAKFNEIVSFAELEEFIDEPIKHYSSGMYFRLAFAVAVNINPDILLIDEIIAVGDESFQKKCFKRMEEFQKQGVTMVLVSHDKTMISKMCNRVVQLDGGRIVRNGEPKSVLRHYDERETE